MMKKAGFTLAEVLITLTIIGVVAMMTLPALMTNVQEQQAVTGLKKGVNTLTEIAQMSSAIGGFDYTSLRAEPAFNDMEAAANSQTLSGMLLSRAQVDLVRSNFTGATPASTALTQGAAAGGLVTAATRIVFFRDGSALIFRPADPPSTPANTDIANDGLPVGFTVIYDINGERSPNMLSNCDGAIDANNDDGNAWGVGADYFNAVPNADNCAARGNRQIKDQFLLQLRGGSVSPVGPASVWTLNH